MRLLQFIFATIFTISISSVSGQNYNPISYAYNGTPTYGVKIKTNIPFTHGVGMPTIILEGYAYGEKKTINVMLNWYVYNGIFHSAHASSSGSFAPNIKLANDSGMVSIFIDEKVFYMRFNVRAFAKSKSETTTMFEGWTAVDEPVSGTSITEVPYESSFSKDVVVTNDNLGIGITNPTSPLHVSNTNDAIATFQTLDDKWLYTNWKNKSGQRKAYMGFSSDLSNFILGLENGANKFTVPTGNVGIGTTNPTQKLEVNGNIQLGYNQFLKGKRLSGAISNLIGYNNSGDQNIVAFSEYSTVPSEVRIYTPTDLNQGVNIFSNKSIAFFRNDGHVGIGTTDPQNELSVSGTIWATKVKVTLNDAADWVFEDDYNLRPLSEVENFIKTHKHLPEIPSAEEFRTNDMEVSEMTNKLLQKIEELTLYTIAQEKKLAEMDALKERLAKLEALLVK